MLFRTPRLTPSEAGVVERTDSLRQRLRYVLSEPKRWNGLLRRQALARAIRGSNTIEGYDVTRDDAVAAAEGDEPFDAEGTTWSAVTGYRRAMTYVLQLAEDPHFRYGPNIIRSLHFMMTDYDLSIRPGQWRPGAIYVRHEPTGEIVYEGPDAALVPGLIDELVSWIEERDQEVPHLVRAAMAHLNLVMIHPFKDGNGRMARCLQTLMLAREGILAPEFSSIEEYLGDQTQEYYRVLAEVGRGKWNPNLDARPWVRFTLTAHFRQANALLARSEEMRDVCDAIEEIVGQRGLPERSVIPMATAAYGFRVRNSNYRSGADVSTEVASKDLKLLSNAGLLIAHGEKRGRYYVGAPLLREICERRRRPRSLEDPFDPSTHQQGALFDE